MNHETLQRLYALDVAEVGNEEAAKRWEYWSGTYWRYNERFNHVIVEPSWCEDIQYRRKPDLPWPKVMDSKKVQELESYICNELRDLKIDTEQTAHEWPSDAPEWANQIVTLYSDGTFVRVGKFEIISTIERPKPVKQKIDWSKLRRNVNDFWYEHPQTRKSQFPSPWIAWNCDEQTRGNPLPDGLVVEWYGQDGCYKPYTSKLAWMTVTRFRIIGIQDGYE